MGTCILSSPVKITDKNLEDFRAWLVKRGRSEGTADLYITNVRTCAAHPKGLTYRLVSGDLAPNTAHANLSSLRAWAAFSKDRDLADLLADLLLPPARRVKTKPPLDVSEWKKIVLYLQTCDIRPEAMRQVLLIMALRGIRASDVLRIRRTEVMHALDTGKLVYEGKGRKRMEVGAKSIRPQLEALAKIKGWDRVRDLIGVGKSPRAMGTKVWRAAQRTARACGVAKVNPHRYRHTYATRFLNEFKGDPNAIIKLQRHMGWASIGTASRYVSHIEQDELDQVGDALVENLLR